VNEMTASAITEVKNKPKVSIGLPVYNGAKYLRKTLDCLLGQTFSDFELIISDDGSTDKTEEICKEYARRDSRVHYFRQPKNFGMPVKNFQFTLSKAVGEYFMFASHDDHWNEDFIEKMTEILNADKDCSLAFSDYKISNLQGEGEILISVSSSNSLSPYIRYLSRIIDIQPVLIFGMFRRGVVDIQDFKFFDFFEVNFGILMALRGKIRIANEYLMEWGVDGTRKSYSITGKRMNYMPFYFAQVRLIWKNFTIFKSIISILILTSIMLNRWLKRLMNPKNCNLSFEK
jgi:glycosyltransferase involved in cell wall biosynthesis